MKSREVSLLTKVEISHKKKNILTIKFETKTNGPAEGFIVIDETTLTYGKAFYRHILPEFSEKSGTYDIYLIKEGLIHAKVSYIRASDRKEINEHYIWEKN